MSVLQTLKQPNHPNPLIQQFFLENMLLNCTNFNRIRSKYFNVDNLQKLFLDIKQNTILEYLKEISIIKYRLQHKCKVSILLSLCHFLNITFWALNDHRCRCALKHQTINQSINQPVDQYDNTAVNYAIIS